MESSIAVFLKRQIACEQLPMKYMVSGNNNQNDEVPPFVKGKPLRQLAAWKCK